MIALSAPGVRPHGHGRAFWLQKACSLYWTELAIAAEAAGLDPWRKFPPQMIECSQCGRITPPQCVGQDDICIDCYDANLDPEVMARLPSSVSAVTNYFLHARGISLKPRATFTVKATPALKRRWSSRGPIPWATVQGFGKHNPTNKKSNYDPPDHRFPRGRWWPSMIQRTWPAEFSRVMRRMTKRQRDVYADYFDLNMTMEEIATDRHMRFKSRVSEMITRIRGYFEDEGLPYAKSVHEGRRHRPSEYSWSHAPLDNGGGQDNYGGDDLGCEKPRLSSRLEK